MGIRSCLVLLAALAALAPPVACANASERGARDSHVFLIVLENHEYDEVIGNTRAPYLNRLARRGTLATGYYAVAHPSLPNYLALLSGSTFGISENCTTCTVGGANLATQLARARLSWRAYMEGLPRRCFRGSESGSYVKRHNPFMYFPSIARNPRRCRRVVPATRLSADLRRHSLPRFGWLSPGLCNDAHDCDIGVADSHLARLAPRILRQLGPRGLLVVTFDEGTSNRGLGGQGGGRVMTVFAGPRIRRGARIGRPSDHYSLLATLEDRLGLPRLRHTRSARPLPLGNAVG